MTDSTSAGDRQRRDLEQERLDALQSATISQLEASDVVIDPAARADVASFDDLEKERLKQASRLRPKFFWLAGGLAVGTVATSCAMVLIIVIGNGTVSDALGVAFASGLTVETLGILTIVGRYLFDPPRKSSGGLDD